VDVPLAEALLITAQLAVNPTQSPVVGIVPTAPATSAFKEIIMSDWLLELVDDKLESQRAEIASLKETNQVLLLALKNELKTHVKVEPVFPGTSNECRKCKHQGWPCYSFININAAIKEIE
jgi:hypothetical protein